MGNETHQINMCEVCGNESLVSVLDLGLHPMCDDLVRVDDSSVCREYPIEILFCENCITAHQRFQIPKKDLFPKMFRLTPLSFQPYILSNFQLSFLTEMHED